MTDCARPYDLMAKAICYLEQEQETQPSLAEVAHHLGISPSHFQRVFTRWVGISPKRYLQHLTLDRVKRSFVEQATVLDATYEAGLSSPGRLHDLFVTWEAMSPGQYAARGAGLEIRYGWFDSPFGEMLALGSRRGLCGLAFAAEMGRQETLADMTRRWPRAEYREEPEAVAGWVKAAFGGGEARLLLSGTPFQIKVWEALLALPGGKIATYSEIAEAVGRPRATRAVGTAVGRNPVSWLIPCHRVLRKSGGLGGYYWGLPTKRAMLAWESARSEAA